MKYSEKSSHTKRQNKSAGEGNDKPSKLLLFAKEKKGFMVAVIVVLLMILVIEVSVFYSSANSQNAMDTKQLSGQNKAQILLVSQNLQMEFAQGDLNQLDMAYAYSIGEDLNWLTDKEKEEYDSTPSTDVYLKEMAFTLVMQRLFEINQDFLLEIGEMDYNSRIAEAENLNLNGFVDISQNDLNEVFSNDYEKTVFESTTAKLFSEYIAKEKNLITNTSSIERKYAEAKKLTWLSYSKSE